MSNLVTVQVEVDLGVNAHDGSVIVSSRYIAQVFSKEHKDVLRAIQNCSCSEEFGRRNFKQSSYKNEQNKKQPEVLLTKDGFTFIVMGFTGKKAAQFKEAYINRFNEMEKALKDLNIARLEYPELTDAIKSMHDEPKFFHYANEADMFNQIILGMKAKEFRKKHGLDKGDSIRPYLTPFQAEAMRKMQQFDVGLVVAVPNFTERKKILQTYFMQTYFPESFRSLPPKAPF